MAAVWLNRVMQQCNSQHLHPDCSSATRGKSVARAYRIITWSPRARFQFKLSKARCYVWSQKSKQLL